MFKVRTMKTESWKNGPALQHDPFQQRCARRRRRRGRKAQHWPRSWPKVPLHGRLSNLSQCLCIVAHLRCLLFPRGLDVDVHVFGASGWALQPCAFRQEAADLSVFDPSVRGVAVLKDFPTRHAKRPHVRLFGELRNSAHALRPST